VHSPSFAFCLRPDKSSAKPKAPSNRQKDRPGGAALHRVEHRQSTCQGCLASTKKLHLYCTMHRLSQCIYQVYWCKKEWQWGVKSNIFVSLLFERCGVNATPSNHYMNPIARQDNGMTAFLPSYFYHKTVGCCFSDSRGGVMCYSLPSDSVSFRRFLPASAHWIGGNVSALHRKWNLSKIPCTVKVMSVVERSVIWYYGVRYRWQSRSGMKRDLLILSSRKNSMVRQNFGTRGANFVLLMFIKFVVM